MRRAALCLFLAVMGCMAALHHPATGWNVNTRLALVLAVVDHGTLSIDAYHESQHLFTMDKAIYEGRYYSDKIFGVSLLALPLYALMKWLAFLFNFTWPLQAIHYALRLFAVSVPAALSVVLMWMLMVRAGAPPRRALAATAIAFFGSVWFGYSSLFMPYSTGIAATIAALYLILFPPAFRLTKRNSLAIGLLLGFALLCDLIFGLIVGAIGIVYLLRLIDQTGVMGMRAFAEMRGDRTPVRRSAILLLATALGGALPLLLFAIYSIAIFGEPTIPYRYEADELFRTKMAEGFMGVKAPDPTALWFLTIHPLRGIFFWYPWLILAIAGFVMGIRSSGRRRIFGWLGLWALIAYLLFNSGYYMWWGGWAMGPRLMLPMFAVVPLGLAEVARRDRHRAWWWAACVLGVIAILLNVPLSFFDPQTPLGYSYDEIIAKGIGDSVSVSQFVYLRVFYSISWLWQQGVPAMLKVAFFAAPAWSAVFFTLAARACPQKHLPFERAELPFVNFDGTAAPPPSMRQRK